MVCGSTIIYRSPKSELYFEMISALIRYFVAFSAGSTLVAARRYAAHDPVQIVANTVGPFNNPTETYPVSITGDKCWNIAY